MQTDIFLIERKSKHIINISNSDNDLINKIKSLKPIEKNDYIVYVHNGLHLIVHEKTKEKECFKVENIKTTINDNLLYMTSKLIQTTVNTFPIINSYDDIIKRSITLYQNNISLIKDNNDIYYLRIKNDDNIAIQMINNFLDAK